MSGMRLGVVLALCLTVGTTVGLAQGGQRFVVQGIEFEGLQRVSREEALARLTFTVGDTVTADQLQENMQRLFELGTFLPPPEAEFRVSLRQVEGGAVVVFHVTETPVIRAIQISGIKRYKTVWNVLGLRVPFFWNALKAERVIEILKDHDVVPFRQVNLNDLNAAVQAVKAAYEEKGFLWISVDQERMFRSLARGQTLVLPLLELAVEQVRLEGLSPELEALARERLQIPLGEPPKLPALQQTFAALNNSIYFEPFDPSDEEQLRLAPGSKVDTLVLHLNLRPRVLIDEPLVVREIVLRGNTAYSTERLRQQLRPWQPETPLDNLSLLRVLEGIYALYHENGYGQMDLAAASPAPGVLEVTIDEGRVRNVRLTVRYESGSTEILLEEGAAPRVRRYALDAAGQATPVEEAPGHTQPYVVLSALRVHPGELFNTNRLRDTARTLMDLGYFEDVQIGIEPVAEEHLADVSFTVVEKTKLGSLNGAMTLADNGLVGKLSVTQRNLLGTGQDVSIEYDRGLVGTSQANWSLNYSTHGFFPEYKDFTVRLFRTFERPEVDEELTRTGGELSLTYPLSSTIDLLLKGRHETFQTCLRGGVSCEPPGITDSITLGAIEDTRDSPVFAMEGGQRSLELEKAGGFSVGVEFTKLSGYLTQHFPVVKDQNVALRLLGGLGLGELPAQEKFALGGPSTVRGLSVARVTRLLVLNAEYRLKWLEAFSTSLFLDAGLGAWSAERSLRSTVGLEAQIVVPFVGLTRLALAWELRAPFSPVPLFSFSFGPMF